MRGKKKPAPTACFFRDGFFLFFFVFPSSCRRSVGVLRHSAMYTHLYYDRDRVENSRSSKFSFTTRCTTRFSDAAAAAAKPKHRARRAARYFSKPCCCAHRRRARGADRSDDVLIILTFPRSINYYYHYTAIVEKI